MQLLDVCGKGAVGPQQDLVQALQAAVRYAQGTLHGGRSRAAGLLLAVRYVIQWHFSGPWAPHPSRVCPLAFCLTLPRPYTCRAPGLRQAQYPPPPPPPTHPYHCPLPPSADLQTHQADLQERIQMLRATEKGGGGAVKEVASQAVSHAQRLHDVRRYSWLDGGGTTS